MLFFERFLKNKKTWLVLEFQNELVKSYNYHLLLSTTALLRYGVFILFYTMGSNGLNLIL